MNPTHVEPDLLATAGQLIGDAAGQLDNGLAELQATVTTDNPWGADEPGTLFGAAYTGVLSHALEVYGSHVGLLAYAGQNLDAWAREVAETDRAADEMFTALHGRTGL
ncbi:hypothetical protein [Micromonospora rubida]|uniref:hypothetical protein n=1 Tax=Micromonospora rubida TaxID=2697657 RepID=UPI001378C724|nr:hypothetical protein [Micromonospora rubida]NBE80765.1 hypothetical protein [Micromonospora rubida]